MIWHGIEITEDAYIPATGIAVIDGRVVHGKGLAWICTTPPCLLDKESGKLVDLPPTLVDALVDLLKAPKPRKPWFERTFPPPALPTADELRVNREWWAFDGGPKDAGR